MDDTIEATLPIVANTLSARFIDSCKYHPETGCWEWIGFWRKGSKTPFFRVWGRERSARRISWELFRGYHLHANCRIILTCDNPRCVCPWHLTTPRLKHEAWRANPKRVGYKLTIDAVHEIRHGPYNRRRLARKYDISEWYVWAIRSGHACPNIASPLLVEPSKEKEKREARSFIARNLAILEDIRKRARE